MGNDMDQASNLLVTNPEDEEDAYHREQESRISAN
jgi:hypothetical protein